MSSELKTTPIIGLVNTALNEKNRSGISQILRWIADATQSSGAVLWEPDPDIPVDDPQARLFTAGHWVSTGKRFAAHDLSIAGSLAGKAIQSDDIQTAENVRDDPHTAKSRAAMEFYREHKILGSRTCPVHFHRQGSNDERDPPARTGAVALYRTADSPPFTDDGKYLLWQFCEVLPGLHDSLHHKVSLALIDEVKDILQDAGDKPHDLEKTCLAVCKAVQTCFQLVETSVFFEDPEHHPGEFHLAGTTCERYIGQRVYVQGKEGLTSWTATAQKPILIWDLRYYRRQREKALIEKLYPGVVWRDPIQAEKTSAELLRLSIEDLPPLSFIAAPILSGGKTCGVLRCCTAKEPPYYFTQRERSLLAVIASQLGQYWTKWRERRTIRDENKAWSKFVEGMSALNYSANAELRKQAPDVMNVLRKGLETTADLVPGGEIMDIRLHDSDADELYFAFTRGTAWTAERKAKRYAASKKPPVSAGSAVFQSGEMEIIPNVKTHPHYKEMFEDARSMMIAPIRSSQRKVYGVIDIRNVGTSPFPSHAKQMAELLGQQLGLYHEVIDTALRMSKAEQELKLQAGITEQAFADWQHQIRGPINQAHVRLQDTIRLEFQDYERTPQYIRIQRGLLGKAKRASRSLRLYLDLAKQQTPRLRLDRIEFPEVVKLLVETCLDNRALAPKRKLVDFDVRQDSFLSLQPSALHADADLLEQAVNNVIDNAFKYSYRQTMIEVTGASMSGFFCISIANIGIPLEEKDLPKVGTRGWRGEKAHGVVGEGSGIGLWVVDHIMKAHKGRLQVMPTLYGRTEVRLLFPWT